MTDRSQRIRLVQGVLVLLLLLYVIRLWELQLTNWVEYAQKAAGNRTQVIRTEPPRGPILDRNGLILAENRAVWEVGVDPAKFPKDEYEANRCLMQLASLLKMDVPRVREAVEKALAVSSAQPVPLEGLQGPRGLDLPAVARLEENTFSLPGIVVLQTRRRFYPYGPLACHVLGYARAITAEQYEELRGLTVPKRISQSETQPPLPDAFYSRNSITGQAGVELLCELDRSSQPPMPMLTGLPGRTVLEVDVFVQPVRIVSFRQPEPGASVYLTLDARVQQVAEKTLTTTLKEKGRAGAVVVLDVNTGEVIAMASRPGFDPNKWVSGFKPQEWAALNSDPRTPLLNTAIAGAYPPGSTFKIVSALAALESTRLNTATSYPCRGRISVGHPATIYRCWSSSGHGYTDFWRGLAESCDVYFYELVRKRRLSPEAIAYWAHQLGLGSVTDCGLAGEAEGLVPTPEWKLTLVHERWRLGDSLNMVIGQGYLTATPLQMAVATAAVANDGLLYKPQLVRKVLWPAWTGRQPKTMTPQLVSKVGADRRNLERIRRAMRLAVTSPRGTAHGLAGLAVSAAGKTGSAEHNPRLPTHAWFVCFAPYEKPQYAVSVFVDSGGHGGSSAVPIARKVLAELFRTEDKPAAGPAESD